MSIETSVRIAVGVLALGIVRPMEAQQPVPPAAVSVPRSVLERYVGEYVYPAGTIASMRLRGDTLIREANGQQEVYTPLSETRFKAGNTPFVAEFWIDSTGAMTQVLKVPNIPGLRLTRIQASSVPTSVLEQYVGDYQFMPRLTIAVRLKGPLLTSQQAGGPEIALLPIPESQTRFRVGTGSNQMEVEFVTDKAGAITKVVRQASYELRGARKRKP